MKNVIQLSEDENTLEVNGVILKACDTLLYRGCSGCNFQFDNSFENCDGFKCSRYDRKDRRNIIWTDLV